MDKNIYANLGQKMNRTYQEKRDNNSLSLKDFLENKWVIHTPLELKKVFIKDLKNVLQKEDLFELVRSFFELEQELAHASERLDFEMAEVNFDEFYKNLSPVLMRALLEMPKEASENASLVLKTLKESLRIALEEELYHLEDRLV